MTGIHFKYTKKDRRPELNKKLAELKGTIAKIGVFGTAGPQRVGQITNVEIAAVHEFGSPAHHIPERSFIRSTFLVNREKYKEMLGTEIRHALEKKSSARSTFARMGLKVASDIQGRIRQADIVQYLSLATLAKRMANTRRGSEGVPKALIDTGQLLRSITYLVDKKEGGHVG